MRDVGLAATAAQVAPPTAAGGSSIDRIVEDDPNRTAATLKICACPTTADRTRISMKELKEQRLGHSFLTVDLLPGMSAPKTADETSKSILEQNSSTQLGFYPASDVAVNPVNSYIPGTVVEPDNQFPAKGWESYTLTVKQLEAFYGFVASHRSAPYSVYLFNCTTFALKAVKAAGHSPPTGSDFNPVAMPNHVYAAIAADRDNGSKDGVAGTSPLDPSESESPVYRHQPREMGG